MIDPDSFTIRLGLPGSCKTLSVTEDVLLPAILNGIDVYANHWLNINLPNSHYYREFCEIENVRNCIVSFDEIGHILEPRNWENESSGVRDFFQQHRHHYVQIEGNTQHLSLIAKSALIEADRFLLLEKRRYPELIKLLFDNILPLTIDISELTLKELKLRESNFKFNDDDFDEFDLGNQSTDYYFKHKLIHRELNNIKKELVHWYCDKCKKRQGEFIPKEKTEKFCYFDKRKGYILKSIVIPPTCPKHKETSLILKESGIYDTQFDIQVPEKQIYWKPFHRSLKETQYKGALSSKQIEYRNKLHNI